MAEPDRQHGRQPQNHERAHPPDPHQVLLGPAAPKNGLYRSIVNTVLLELSTELICDNMPLASPAITTPLKPTGTSSRTSIGKAWSVSFSQGTV